MVVSTFVPYQVPVTFARSAPATIFGHMMPLGSGRAPRRPVPDFGTRRPGDGDVEGDLGRLRRSTAARRAAARRAARAAAAGSYHRRAQRGDHETPGTRSGRRHGWLHAPWTHPRPSRFRAPGTLLSPRADPVMLTAADQATRRHMVPLRARRRPYPARSLPEVNGLHRDVPAASGRPAFGFPGQTEAGGGIIVGWWD